LVNIFVLFMILML